MKRKIIQAEKGLERLKSILTKVEYTTPNNKKRRDFLNLPHTCGDFIRMDQAFESLGELIKEIKLLNNK